MTTKKQTNKAKAAGEAPSTKAQRGHKARPTAMPGAKGRRASPAATAPAKRPTKASLILAMVSTPSAPLSVLHAMSSATGMQR